MEWGLQKIFQRLKEVIGKRYNVKKVLHTNASDLQLWAVILQEGEPIAYHSLRLNSSQCRYTTTENGLFGVVKTLKNLRLLLGYNIEVHKNHKYLVHKNVLILSDSVIRWRLIINEYGLGIFYIPGQTIYLQAH